MPCVKGGKVKNRLCNVLLSSKKQRPVTQFAQENLLNRGNVKQCI